MIQTKILFFAIVGVSCLTDHSDLQPSIEPQVEGIRALLLGIF